MTFLTRIAALLFVTPIAVAATFTVDTTSDAILGTCAAAPGDCSLRGAIAASNGLPGLDTINFNIPLSDAGCTAGSGVCRITVASVMTITALGSVIIDGYSQPGASVNTIAAGSGGLNSVLKIEIVSSTGGGHAAFSNQTNASFTLRGVAISGFLGGSGAIFIQSTNGQSNFEGNYFGTDASGNAVPVRNRAAISLASSGAQTIGGLLPAHRNLISNNDRGINTQQNGTHIIQGNLIGTSRDGTQALPNSNGIFIFQALNTVIGGSVPGALNVISGNATGVAISGGSGAVQVQGNRIGTDASGTQALGNTINGVEIGPGATASSGILVGGSASPEQANIIAFNGRQGVATRGIKGTVLGNQIFGNQELSIGANAVDNGSTTVRRANDLNDADNNISNKGQNFPEISAVSLSAGSVNLSYRVDSAIANSTYPLRVEFFKADGDEGRTFLFSDSYLTAQAQSVKPITNPVLPSGVSLTGDDVIVATATDADGNTSEFSFQPLSLVIDQPIPSACSGNVRIFCDAFESNPQRSLEVTVRATSTVFKPNGNVRLSDNRGSSCTLSLVPSATALTSSGSCVLAGSGAPGPITITATHDKFTGAFANTSSGENIVQTNNFVVLMN